MSHVSHRSTLPPPPDRVGRLTGTAAVSVHATSIAGGTQRDPEGTSREPRRRCYGHRRGISLPKALYQNAARMSRGAEGTTEASGRRDQAGLAARKRRVGAVRGAVPAQNEPKSDRPRAKTPMNRRKSRLRRRAAPILIWPSRPGVVGFGSIVYLAVLASNLLTDIQLAGAVATQLTQPEPSSLSGTGSGGNCSSAAYSHDTEMAP